MTDTAAHPITSTAAHNRAVQAEPAPDPAPPAASTLGDPFALGLASFGITALVLATLISGVVDTKATIGVLSLALAVGFLTEFVAGIFHFMRGETFAAMVFVTYSGFWLSFALLVQFYSPAVVAGGGDAAQLVGMYLLVWGIFSTYMLLAALKTNRTTIAIFTVLCAVFYVDAIGTFAGSTGLVRTAGFLLILDAAIALYASAALIVNDTWGRAVLPVP